MRIVLWTTLIAIDAAHGALALPVLAGVVIVASAEAHSSARRRARLPKGTAQWHQPPSGHPRSDPDVGVAV
jgi:hypothetical protein